MTLPDADRLFPVDDRNGDPATREQLAEAERELEVVFPDDYREFLTGVGSFNGHLLGKTESGLAYHRFFALDEVLERSLACDEEDWPFAIIGDTGGSWMYVLRMIDNAPELILYDFGSGDVLQTYGTTFTDLVTTLLAEDTA